MFLGGSERAYLWQITGIVAPDFVRRFVCQQPTARKKHSYSKAGLIGIIWRIRPPPCRAAAISAAAEKICTAARSITGEIAPPASQNEKLAHRLLPQNEAGARLLQNKEAGAAVQRGRRFGGHQRPRRRITILRRSQAFARRHRDDPRIRTAACARHHHPTIW